MKNIIVKILGVLVVVPFGYLVAKLPEKSWLAGIVWNHILCPTLELLIKWEDD